MKDKLPATGPRALPRAAAVHSGQATTTGSPRQLAQGAQIAQLQAAPPLQLNGGDRKTKGFSRGASHSTTTPSGKVRSHKPGKGREENPRKSAAKNRKRDRLLAANVANSQKK